MIPADNTFRGWQKLFLFCLGLFMAASFCMKWMERDLYANGENFTVIGLEVSYPKEKIVSVFTSLDPGVKTILNYHLSFDFIFMPGVFLGILAICMMARLKTGNYFLKRVLLVLGFLQLVAWGLDITENSFLLSWLKNPVIGNEFTIYHMAVYTKWIIALAGVIVGIPVLLFGKKIQ